MKLIIAGGRDIETGLQLITQIIETYYSVCHGDNTLFDPTQITEVVSGGANGIDSAGELWANVTYKRNDGSIKSKIKVKRFKPDWKTYGKAAGPIRNKKMAKYADALLLIWDGKSKGSANMKKEMKALGKPIFEEIVK